MLPTILSQSDLRRFCFQIKDEKIGIDGQEKLKYSKVVIQGLSGIGIAVMCCLLTAGVGKIAVIDNGMVTEDMLPSQTLFGVDDIGKLRCIAAREKQIGGALDNSLKLYNTVLRSENAERLIGEAKIVIKTSWETDFDEGVLNLADKNNIQLIGGYNAGWKGVFGKYSQEKRSEFRNLYNHLYKQYTKILPDNIKYNGFSFAANFTGSILSSLAIKILLGIDHKCSEIYEMDMLNLYLKKLL